MRDTRYRRERTISRNRGRIVDLAHDRWCDVPVILKQAPLRAAMREVSCLLRLPPGIAPRLQDLLWRGREKLGLVLEHLDGRTLAEHVRIGAHVDVPRLASEISQALAHLHRIGWVHSDLKPDNVFLLANDVEGPIRLLDFGYAFDRFADSPASERGGTVRYVAPEIRRGWIADGRADLYSLGMVLRACFPALKSDPAWRGILENLTSPIPADRYPHAIALRDAIAQAFALEPSMTRFPGFPAGPMRGRSTELQWIVQTARSFDRSVVLVQARPGTGLTRFLLESLLELAEADAPAARIVDFGNLPSSALEQAVAFLDRNSVPPAIVLCGVPDPSPALSWLPERSREHLNRLRARLDPRAIQLPPLTEESFRELVVTSLGSLDSGSEAVVAPLIDQTEGDLVDAAIAFKGYLRSAGSEDGPNWRLPRPDVGANAVRGAISATVHPIPEPSASMIGVLRLCARAGFAFRTESAESLLARFDDRDSLEGLVEHGYLFREKPDRLRFVSRRLWRSLASEDDPLAPSIDRWLNERATPDLDDIDEVWHSCHVAERVGDRDRASRMLADALARAYKRRRWSDVLRLARYPEGSTDEQGASESDLDALAARLEGALSPERLRLMVGASMTTVDPQRGVRFLEAVDAGADPQVACEALVILIDRVADQASGSEYGRYAQTLGVLARAGTMAPPGTLEFFEARHLLASGDPRGALLHAEHAAHELKGSDSFYEPLSLQLVAILRFPSSPETAIGYLCSAVASAQDIELEAQLRHNLALAYGDVGPFHLAEECTDSHLRRVGHLLSPARRIGLRSRRAWAWADLDRIEPAICEARALLSLSRVRLALPRSIPLRLLVAYGHVHRGNAAAALKEAFSAWKDVLDAAPPDLEAQCLRFVLDVLIDLEDWEFVRNHATDFQERILGPNPVFRTVGARASAVLAQAEGRSHDALELLRQHVDEGRRLVERLSAARYLHHVGIAALLARSGTADEHLDHMAGEIFTEELSVLIAPGHGYYRGRALLELSKAAQHVGDFDQASRVLAEAITLARGIGSTGLLTDCLEAQARLLVDPR